jgi:hypothetical protein
MLLAKTITLLESAWAAFLKSKDSHDFLALWATRVFLFLVAGVAPENELIKIACASARAVRAAHFQATLCSSDGRGLLWPAKGWRWARRRVCGNGGGGFWVDC